jgi:mono/diheme cytochrome c family protein
MGLLRYRKFIPAILAGGLLAIILIAGCNKTATGPATSPAGPPIAGGPNVPAQATGGQGIFQSKCMRCHSFGAPTAGGQPGAGGPPGMARSRGPDLAKVGNDPKHTKDWIIGYVRDPKSQKPDARMPPLGNNQISDADLGTLVDYLLSQKDK